MEQEHLVRDLIKKAMPTAVSYEDYRKQVDQLAAARDTTGKDKSENRIQYTLLNSRRMKRWDKTFKLSQDQLEGIRTLDGEVIWLVLTESWCGDAAPSLPVMHKIASEAVGIDLRVLLRDQHPDLMDHFLTAGNRSIPKLVMLNKETLEVMEEWGPRPSQAKTMAVAFKKKHGKLTPEFKESLQKWYNQDKGQNIGKELLQLLALKEVGNSADL